mmetsp:Transcript_51164/g.164281  ORF Transcript_51164/g.164281 Transcript_51164/m.164281 type:complete len:350 (-) Transcript_51164:61-1110(-)
MLERARTLGCQLRPHQKTHKTLEAGAIVTGGSKRCVAVSTLAEAEFFADGGFDDILYAVPISAEKLPRAAALVQRLEKFHIALDHPDTLSQVLSRGPCEGKVWSVFLMVDCGYGRDGVDPLGDVAMEMAKRLQRSDCAKLAGLYTHGGHSYEHEGVAEAVARVRQTAAEEAAAVVGLAARLRAAGVEVPIVGVGSTPTCSNPPLDGLEGVNEMHPGNYCYYDVMQEKIGSCTEDDIAVRVATRVIGHYAARGLLLVDMGWTACSKQGESCGFGRIEGHPELVVAGLKQEAGLLKASGDTPLDLSKYPLGTVLRLEPYHSCAHTKQHDRVHVLADDRETVEEAWRICRGW